jgi:hypothetical protein
MNVNITHTATLLAVQAATTQVAECAALSDAFAGDVTIKVMSGSTIRSTVTTGPFVTVGTTTKSLQFGAVIARTNISVGAADTVALFNANVEIARLTDLTFSGSIKSACLEDFSGLAIEANTNLPVGSNLTLASNWPTNVEAPASLDIEDWRTGVAVVAGSIVFNQPTTQMTMEDARIAASWGVAATVIESSQSVIFDTFEFGASAYYHPTLGDGSTPLYQVEVRFKPAGRWSTFPFYDTWNDTTDRTIPSAFKVRIRNSLGADLGVVQMRDSLPVNSPSLSQFRTATEALRPFVNCANVLPWQNKRPRTNATPRQFLPGPSTNDYRDTGCKIHFASNPPDGVYASTAALANNQSNNGSFLWSAPEWPAGSANPGSALFALDPELSPQNGSGTNTFMARGWNYEPGSSSLHDENTGMGGTRFDRGYANSALLIMLANPSYIRPIGAVPIANMVHSYGMAYANHSVHWITNVKTGAGLLLTLTQAQNELNTLNSFYASGDTFPVPALGPANRTIDIRANGQATLSNLNKYFELGNLGAGKRWYGNRQVDAEHNYHHPWWMVSIMNSPMHVAWAKRFTINQFGQRVYDRRVSWPGATTLPTDTTTYSAMNRRFAWELAQMCWAWEVGTTHAYGYARSEIESMLIADLTDYKTRVVDVTMSSAADNSPFHVAVRRFGTPASVRSKYPTGEKCLAADSLNLFFYIGPVFQQMKLNGLWSILMSNPACNASLMFISKCLLLRVVDYRLDALAAGEKSAFANDYGLSLTQLSLYKAVGQTPALADLPTSWADWLTKFPSQSDSQFKPDGDEYLPTVHMQHQFINLWSDYFSDVTVPGISGTRIAQAKAAWNSDYAAKTTLVNAAAAGYAKTLADWNYRMPHVSLIASPSETGL